MFRIHLRTHMANPSNLALQTPGPVVGKSTGLTDPGR